MEKLNSVDNNDCTIIRAKKDNSCEAHGVYTLKCFDKYGKLKWSDIIENTVTNVGKNLALDTFLAGSGYSVVGPFLGLISSVGYTGVPVVGDTMASHATWFEVDAATHFPTVAARLTTNGGWSAASAGAKALTSPLSFTIITNGGTLKGCFLVYGSGAVSTLGSTAGILYSAGLFSGGDKIVSTSDVVQCSYSTSL